MFQTDYFKSRGNVAYRLWMFDVLISELKKRPYNQEKKDRLLRQMEGYSKNQKFLMDSSSDDRDQLARLQKRLKGFSAR